MRQPFGDEVAELGEGQLAYVERIGIALAGGIAVCPAIWRGHDEQAVLGENAVDLGKHLLLSGDVLDHLERDDDVEAPIGYADRSAASPTTNDRPGAA